MPFSTEKLSAGRPANDQARICMGFPSVLASENFSEQGIFWRTHSAFQSSKICARYCNEKAYISLTHTHMHTHRNILLICKWYLLLCKIFFNTIQSFNQTVIYGFAEIWKVCNGADFLFVLLWVVITAHLSIVYEFRFKSPTVCHISVKLCMSIWRVYGLALLISTFIWRFAVSFAILVFWCQNYFCPMCYALSTYIVASS